MDARRSSLGPGDNSPTSATSRSNCRAFRTCSTGRSALGARDWRPRRSSVLRRSEPRRRSTTLRRSFSSPTTATDCRRGSARRSVPVRRSAHSLVNTRGSPGFGGQRKLSRNQPFCESYHQRNSQLPGQSMMPLTPIAAVVLVFQSVSPAPPTSLSTTTAVAQRATTPPTIDGEDDDAVWRLAPVIKDFRQFQPTEDANPSFPTEAKVAYDDHNFYVFVRAFDSHPDSIKRLLARRDVRICCDQIKIIIDSYHDRRTGFEFAVNPGGVKRDYAIYGDGQEDDAWDGVWEVATRVDSLGWTAEFRIPLSQLRYPHAPTNTFGFGVWRDIDRRGGERVSWPLFRQSRRGFPSQLGEVVGLEGLAAPRRLEVAPYAVVKNEPAPGFERDQKYDGGADIKFGITSNITVDATVNPDFGQVEADPAVVNLTSFETFYQERRPFFVEGTGIFNFRVNCNIVNCSGEGLFYSRRIGHDPTRILGAAKITGRLPGGLTIGAVEGITKRATQNGATVEPFTNYGVLRLSQDYRNGQSGIGFMGTAVNRTVDPATEGFLRDHAYVGAVDFRHRFHGGAYE